MKSQKAADLKALKIKLENEIIQLELIKDQKDKQLSRTLLSIKDKEQELNHTNDIRSLEQDRAYHKRELYYKNSLDTSRNDLNRLNEELQSVHATLAQSNKLISDNNAIIANQLKKIESTNIEYEMICDEYGEKITFLRDTIDEKDNQITFLNGQISQKEIDLNNANARNTNEEIKSVKHLEGINRSISLVKEELNSLIVQKKKYEADISATRTQDELREKHLSSREAALGIKTRALDQQRQDLSEKQYQFDQRVGLYS